MEYNGYKPGYIYVLKAGPYYKIGYADDVEQRLKSVGASARPDDLTEPIDLLFSFQTTSKMVAERTLHGFFSSLRVKGEWFRLSDRHVEILRRFVDGYSVDEFVMEMHRIPTDITLFTQREIDFYKTFGVKHVDEDGKEIMPDDLVEAIDQARRKRSRADRAKRYRRALNGMLEHASVDDLEWLMEAMMRRGITPEVD